MRQRHGQTLWTLALPGMLVERVETREEFVVAKNAGFLDFQGQTSSAGRKCSRRMKSRPIGSIIYAC